MLKTYLAPANQILIALLLFLDPRTVKTKEFYYIQCNSLSLVCKSEKSFSNNIFFQRSLALAAVMFSPPLIVCAFA